jgi:Asp-tRNA(Asn)/Glu-tRNA(Gln) amidotransferase A subunit family amidase
MTYAEIDPVLTSSTADIRAGFGSGDLTPTGLLESTLSHLATVNAEINAIPYVDFDGARQAAVSATARWASGRQIGDFDGIPVTVKDSILAIGLPWRHGAKANEGLPNATADSPPAARLREAGAVIIGKTAMPDFGMLASGVSSLYGITRNPWDLTTNPGGSSSGAGASLAAGVAWGSVGSDIAGSVRLPAAHCGLVALKPTQGRIPHLPSSTIRSAGPMARTVAEAGELFALLCRPDARDNLSLGPEVVDVDAIIRGDVNVRDLRVGVLLDVGHGYPADDEVIRVVLDAAETFRRAGAPVQMIPAPFDTDPYPSLDRLFQVRARAEWEALAPETRAGVLPAVSEWATAASRYTAADHERDLVEVYRSQARFADRIDAYDIVLSPVLPVAAFPAERAGLVEEAPLAHTAFTCWYNQTGQPALSLCFGFSKGHPVGVQISGKRFADQLVLRAASWLERRRPFPMNWPLVPRPEALIEAAA